MDGAIACLPPPPSSNSIERSGGVDSNRSCRRIKKGRLFYLAQGQVWNSSQLILRSTAKRRGRDEKKFSSYLPPCRFTFSSPGRKKMEIAARFEARLRETRNTRNLIFLPSFGHLRNGSPNGPSPDLLSSFSRNQFARVKFLPFPFSLFFLSFFSFSFSTVRRTVRLLGTSRRGKEKRGGSKFLRAKFLARFRENSCRRNSSLGKVSK